MLLPSDTSRSWPGPSLFEGPASPELVAELAHTLRSRLTSILFLADALEAGADAWDPGQRRQLALLNGSAVKMSVFTSNLMELARGGDDLVGFDPQPLSVAELLRAVRDTLRPLTGGPGPSLRLRGDAVGQRLGYPMALQRTLLSLATAGLELTPEGDLEIAAAAGEAAAVEFTVHAPDAVFAGSAHDLERVVTPRSEGDGWSWSSVGLSIATARHLLGKLGVALEVEAGDERGLRFRFEADLPPLDHDGARSAPRATRGSVGAAARERGVDTTPDAPARRTGATDGPDAGLAAGDGT